MSSTSMKAPKSIGSIGLSDDKYTIVEGNINFIYRIDDSRGNTVLRFNMEEGEGDDYHIKDANDELVGIMGRHYNSPEIPEGHDGDYVIYSVIEDEPLASISLSWTTGAKVTNYNNSEEIVTVDVNNLRRLYAVFGKWPINALLTRKWKFNSPSKGQIGKLEENNSFNPFGKPTNELSFDKSVNLTDFEKLCVMGVGTIAVY